MVGCFERGDELFGSRAGDGADVGFDLVAGGAFLVLCDSVARSIVPGRELPVGVVTAAVGAPALVLLLLKARQS